MIFMFFFFFFFQAEDGIRDYKVTGVQTCALPIYRRELGADPATERGAHEAHAVEAERVEQIEVVEREVGDVLDPRRVRGAPVAGMARGVHGEGRGETLLERKPPSGAAGAVEEEQGGTRAGGQEVDRGPADRELAALDRHQPANRP